MSTAGVAWVNTYAPYAKNLRNNCNNVQGLADALGVSPVFDNGEAAAADADFEVTPGGSATCPADVADLVYFSGHGNINGAIFGRIDRDDGFATPDKLRFGSRCRWLVLDACEVLQRSADKQIWHKRLANVFAGLHYMFGFDTVASDSARRGRLFGQGLRSGWTVREAWRRACVETEDSTRRYAYMRAKIAGIDTLQDRWVAGGQPSPPPTGEQSRANFFYLCSNC